MQRLRSAPGARVLELGPGSGRNTRALREAGFAVEPIVGDAAGAIAAAGTFEAALSTHALLHGTPQSIGATLDAVAARLLPSAPFYATFASKADARFGSGTRIDENTFAPQSGDETGVAHAYFAEDELRHMLATRFVIEVIEERNVDEIVGSWAHAERPRGSVHWFVRARRR